MKELAIVLFVTWLLSCFLAGCATREERPRAMPENHPLELMMWDEWQERHVR